jgi:hypothetical protein
VAFLSSDVSPKWWAKPLARSIPCGHCFVRDLLLRPPRLSDAARATDKHKLDALLGYLLCTV